MLIACALLNIFLNNQAKLRKQDQFLKTCGWPPYLINLFPYLVNSPPTYHVAYALFKIIKH